MLAPEASGPWDGYIYVRDGYGVFRQENLGVAAVKSRNLGSVVTDRTSILFCVYHNPDLRMFTNIILAAVHAEEVRASFLFIDDLNGHHQEWLASTTTNP